MKNITNPILPGYYPDPSLCRVGEDYYLVNSTFSYFPGLPLFKSQDLVHWNQIGHVLDRDDQLPLQDAMHSGGLFAPTIRYHEGLFYVICTNVTTGGNFYVTAEDPKGPWSEVYWLEGAEGIDPSLFFDEEGRCWYCGTRAIENQSYSGENEIWLQELDLVKHKLTGPIYSLWRGALRQSVWPEGPHIYKIGDYYYLLISEGGTEMDHALTIARATDLTGPWEGRKSNPFLTHRHLGHRHPFCKIGHGDLFEDHKGQWWLICLGSRQIKGVSPLGRETFLTPIRWEEDWPYPDTVDGLVPANLNHYFEGRVKVGAEPFITFDINKQGLSHEWIGLRNPPTTFYEAHNDNPNLFKLYPSSGYPGDQKQLAFLGCRQTSHNYDLAVSFRLEEVTPGLKGGFMIIQSDENLLLVEQEVSSEELFIHVKEIRKGVEKKLNTLKSKEKETVSLNIKQRGTILDIDWLMGSEKVTLIEQYDTSFMSTEEAGGFVGNVNGLYLSQKDDVNSSHAYLNLLHWSWHIL